MERLERDIDTLNAELSQALRLALALGHGEVGAEIEQIVLDAPKHRIQFGRIGQMHPHNADRGVVSSTEP